MWHVWFLDQAIWREEHKSKYDFEKIVEEWEYPECRDLIVILYKGPKNKEQLEVVEEVENSKVVITTLNASQDHGIHSCEEFVPEGSDYFQ